MSLDEAQRRATVDEFAANLALAGLSREEVCEQLDMPAAELAAILAMEPAARPERVWLLRDHLDHAIRRLGIEPHPWATMTEARRADAERWFGIAPYPAG